VPTATPTPAPTVSPPELDTPEDGSVFSGEEATIELSWLGGDALRPNEYYVVRVRWTEDGAQAFTEVPRQSTSWFVDSSLYARADLDAERLYFWSVRLARKETDAEGSETYVPVSPFSEERSFDWK
jgi:hypothetical protein